MAAEIKRKIRFTRNYEVKDFRAGTSEAEAYKAGKIYEIAETSAMHFVARGVAELADGK
jgi:hypothetical protein